jgi:hypothetical protein
MGAHGTSAKQREYLCKEDHNEAFDVREDGDVKILRIKATVGENLVSIDKDTTNQPLQTAHQYTWWYSQASPWTYAPSWANSIRRQMLTYQTHRTKLISGIQDPASNTGRLQFNELC